MLCVDSGNQSGSSAHARKRSSTSRSYYVLSYTSTNHLKDGRFRRLKVQVNRPDVKLEYRAGYYAGRDFEHMKQADREQQLEDELLAELPQTDVAVYAGTPISARMTRIITWLYRSSYPDRRFRLCWRRIETTR